RYTADDAELCATVQELCAKTLVGTAHVWQPGLNHALRSLGLNTTRRDSCPQISRPTKTCWPPSPLTMVPQSMTQPPASLSATLGFQLRLMLMPQSPGPAKPKSPGVHSPMQSGPLICTKPPMRSMLPSRRSPRCWPVRSANHSTAPMPVSRLAPVRLGCVLTQILPSKTKCSSTTTPVKPSYRMYPSVWWVPLAHG